MTTKIHQPLAHAQGENDCTATGSKSCRTEAGNIWLLDT